MDSAFHLFPEQASQFAPRVDGLFVFLCSVSALFVLLIALAVVSLAVFFRKSAPARRRVAGVRYTWLIESFWIGVPLFLTLVMFGWGAWIYVTENSPPRDALPIDVVAKQWMWKIQQPGGRREINRIHLPVGTPVRLRLISEDVIHSFYVPAFRVKTDVRPNDYSSLWFEPTRTGTFHLFCAEYCGTGHSQMIGEVVVLPAAEYAAWASAGDAKAPEAAGAELFGALRCASCHAGHGGVGPALANVYNRASTMTDGRIVNADETHLRESIFRPQEHVRAGYPPIMPSFEGQLDEEQVNRLIAYLKSLSRGQGDAG